MPQEKVGANHASQPPLNPIEVVGLFHRVRVDVLQLPLTENGNRDVVVFQNYLTSYVGRSICGP